MAGIRTVMVTTPRLLRDIIKQLAVNRIDLDVIAELNVRHMLARRLRAIRPDLVVIGLRPNETVAVIRALLTQVPDTKFITLSSNGRSALGFELRLYQTDLGDASLDGLIDFIRNRPSNLDIQLQPREKI